MSAAIPLDIIEANSAQSGHRRRHMNEIYVKWLGLVHIKYWTSLEVPMLMRRQGTPLQHCGYGKKMVGLGAQKRAKIKENVHLTQQIKHP